MWTLKHGWETFSISLLILTLLKIKKKKGATKCKLVDFRHMWKFINPSSLRTEKNKTIKPKTAIVFACIDDASVIRLNMNTMALGLKQKPVGWESGRLFFYFNRVWNEKKNRTENKNNKKWTGLIKTRINGVVQIVK